jgi:cellulose 1,4-beta-cellobiosidase
LRKLFMAGVAVGAIALTAIALTAVAASASTQACSSGHAQVADGRYEIRAGNFGGPLTISHHGDGPHFTVRSSTAFDGRVRAFPNIFIGCSWGICSRGHRYPELVAHVNNPAVTWRTSRPRGGFYNTSLDIWYARHRIITGQAAGAEIMIWLNERGFGSISSTRIARIDGYKFHVIHWTTSGHGKHWNYIQYRLVSFRNNVSYLRIRPFMADAERHGLLSSKWYMLNIEAGFEIVSGGKRLSTSYFWAQS